MYLQGVRSGTLATLSESGDPEDTFEAQNYHANLRGYTSRLASELSVPVTAVLSPPSRFPQHAEPYRRAVLANYPGAADITDRLSRSSDALSGENAVFSDIHAALSYQVAGDESGISSVVIVDDVFSSGRMAAAIILRLRTAGLQASCPSQWLSPCGYPGRLTNKD
jgi:hypothetical protein